jgi:glycosyltransferase involved in cell wall biosynthesis
MTSTYEFGFLLEQSLGHVTHAKNLLTNITQDSEVHAHWGLIDFDASGFAGNIPVYRRNWTVRAGVRAYRQVARMNKQTKLDALFFHTQVPAILAQSWVRKIPSIVSLDATPLQYDELGVFYKHEKGPAWLEALKWRLNRDCFRSARRLVAWSEWTKLGLVRDYEVPAEKITVIPPGVNVQEWRRPTPREPHADPVKILFVGGDLERKGGLLLLEAFRSLRHLGLELHLVTKDRLPPEPGIFVYNNLEANSQPLKDLYHTCDIFASLGIVCPWCSRRSRKADLQLAPDCWASRFLRTKTPGSYSRRSVVTKPWCGNARKASKPANQAHCPFRSRSPSTKIVLTGQARETHGASRPIHAHSR